MVFIPSVGHTWYMFTIIAYIVIGLIGGTIAKAIMPGEEGAPKIGRASCRERV